MAPDKSCALIIPDGYYSHNFNNTQLLGYIKNDDFPALIVYKENKRNFNNTDIKDLNSYVNTIKKMTEENELLKSLELNPVVGYNFNGYGGVLLKYKFNMDNFGYTYFNYMFETSDSYFQFIVSFVGNAYENKKDVMYQMINSFVLTDQNNSNPPNQANLESKLFTKEDYKKMGSPDSLFIPYGYTIIGENALSSCYNLKYVYIPNSVKIIGEKSFFGCSDMTFVNIPNSVTQIGEQAFFSCRSLESIIIPESVTRIEKSTFGFCIKLNNLNIPNTVTHIGSQAFRNTDIKDLKLPNSITSIDFSAFTECGNLESVIIPSSLVEIGNNVFEKCKKLKAIKVKNTIIYEKMKKEYGRIVKQ